VTGLALRQSCEWRRCSIAQIQSLQAVYDDPREYEPLIADALQRVANEVERIINPSPEDNMVRLAEANRR
jgi:hypothetical protein